MFWRRVKQYEQEIAKIHEIIQAMTVIELESQHIPSLPNALSANHPTRGWQLAFEPFFVALGQYTPFVDLC